MSFRAAFRVLSAALSALALIQNPTSAQTLDPPVALTPRPGGQVRAVAWSPTDSIFVTGTNAGGMGVWNQATDPPTLLDDRPNAHDSAITAIVFRPAGPTLGDHQFLSASLDRSARIWSVPGQQVRALPNTLGVDLAASDKNLIAFGATIGSARSVVVLDPFDPSQARPSGSVSATQDVVSVAWLKGDWLAAADASVNIQLWQKTASTNALTAGNAVTAAGVTAVSLLASDKKHTKLVSAGADGSLRVWPVTYDGSGVPSLATTTVLVPAAAGTTIASLAVNADGSLAATADRKKVVQIVPTNGTTAPTPLTIVPASATPQVVRFVQSGNREVLLIGLDTGSVLVWDPAVPATPPAEIVKVTGVVTAIAYSDPWLLIGSQANPVQVFRSDLTAATPKPGRPLGTQAKAIVPVALNGLPLFVVRDPSTSGLSLWQATDTTKPAPPLTTIDTNLSRVHGAAWSNNGRRAFFGLADGRVQSWSESPGVANLIPSAATVLNAIAFSPDRTPSGRRFLATGGDDGVVKVWDPANPSTKPIESPGHTDPVLCLAYQAATPFTLASGSADRSVRFWDAKGTAVGSIWFHPGFVQALAFNPKPAHNTWVASGDSQGNVFVFDMKATAPVKLDKTFASVAMLPGNPGVLCLAWNPDGDRLVVGASDGNAYIIKVH